MNETTEKKHENVFKFGLYQNGQPVIERIFSADNYNPVVRYSVDIRSLISGIIGELTKTLSRKNLSYNFLSYNNLEIYKARLKNDPKRVYPSKLETPNYCKFRKGSTEFFGVEFKIGLYINNHPIVERNFGVEDYNPSSRFSKELVYVMDSITSDIEEHLKYADTDHMWDDNQIIKTYGFNIGLIRDLSKSKRQDLLLNIKNDEYIKRIKNEFKIHGSEVEEDIEAQ